MVSKTSVNLVIITECESVIDPTVVDVKDKMTFTTNLGSRVKLKVFGDTRHSEYYTGFMIDFPVTVEPNTPTYYNYSYEYSDYGDRFEYCTSGAMSFDILIDGIAVQHLSKPLSDHHNKVYLTDKYEIVITIVQK